MRELDAEPVDGPPTVPRGADAPVPFSPIGVGRPLAILLRSVYLGHLNRRPALLITSRVKNPLLAPEGVQAMNIHKGEVEDREIVTPGSGAGSQVVYYTPALAERALTASVSMYLDAFDANAVRKWIDAGANIASLPAFVAGGSTGQAVVKAAQAAGGLAVRLVHQFLTGKPVELEWELHVEDPGHSQARAGWYVLYPDRLSGDAAFDAPAVWSWLGQPVDDNEPVTIHGKDFFVRDGRLRSRQAPDEPFRGAFPYALVTLDGTTYRELSHWKPAAVTADLSARSLNTNSDGELQGDLTAAFSAYSDVLTLHNADTIRSALSDKSLPDNERTKLQKQLDARLKNVQDSALKELVKQP